MTELRLGNATELLDSPVDSKSRFKDHSEPQPRKQSSSEEKAPWNFDPPEKDRPRVTACSGESIVPVNDTNQTTSTEVEDLSESPLGPVPVPRGETVPLDYWAPLGTLTGTRPPVDACSLSRYSPDEWRLRNEKIFEESRNGIQRTIIVESEAKRCASKAFADTDKNQGDNNIRLAVRAGVIFRWKAEIERTVGEVEAEMNTLRGSLLRTQRSNSTLQVVENICQDVKHARCFRMEPDLVRDCVDEEIRKEIFLCEEIRDVYERLLDRIKIQQEELKRAKQRLEFDWSEKKESYEIDCESLGLNDNSETLLWKKGSVRIPADQSTTSSYEDFAEEGIVQARTAVHRSKVLRANVSSIIEKAVRDLRNQADRTDLILAEKINDYVQALRRLEHELSKVLRRISDMERVAVDMRLVAKKLDGSMKCVQTRLDNRLRRHGAENCRDIPQHGFIDEAKCLAENVTAVLGQARRADESTEFNTDLSQARRSIEKDMIVKRKSLYVDQERCQLIRSYYPSSRLLCGY